MSESKIQLESRLRKLESQLKETERQRDNYKDQLKISDEGWNFHNKRANDLIEKYNRLEADLKQQQDFCGHNALVVSEWAGKCHKLREALGFISSYSGFDIGLVKNVAEKALIYG